MADARNRARIEQLHASGSPLFTGVNRLQLGTFCTNLSGGCTMSSMEGVLDADWSSSLALAQLADQMSFEAIVPVGRWKGFGGTTNFNGAGFEAYSWAAGLAASTKAPALFATSHVTTAHPIMAAKQAATIDHISKGRFALNVVTGWNKPEIEMFGSTMLDHESRYQNATEWLEIVVRLWTEEEPFDYDGRFYRVAKAELRPKPIQKPFPPLMNAGGSDTGRHFAARYCDVAFVQAVEQDEAGLSQRVKSYRDFAWDEYRREIQVWTNAYIIQGETEEDAKRQFDYCVHEKGDWEGVENMVGTMMANKGKPPPPSVMENIKKHLIAGWGGFPMVGTKEQVVDRLGMLFRAGFNGVLLSWPQYLLGMQQFQSETLPLVKQAGLR